MSKNNIIVAVVGLCGSGKTEATQMFINNNFERVYFGDITFEEMKKQNMELNPENERKIREQIRRESNNDMAIYAKMSQPKIKAFYDSGKNVIVESMYSWSEYKFLKDIYKDNFKILAIVTDRDLRAKRLKTREIRPLTDEQVTARDYAEIENIEKGGPIAIADHFIINNTRIEHLQKEVQSYIDLLLK